MPNFIAAPDFLAPRPDDASLRADYLSSEMDVAAGAHFNLCSGKSRMTPNGQRTIKSVSILNPWLHLPLLSLGSVGETPGVPRVKVRMIKPA